MQNESTQGEFRGDFSRDTFRPDKRFTQVFMQQGRLLLDADWNEQTSILLHYLRSLVVDLMGPHGTADLRTKDKKGNPTNSTPIDFEVWAGSTGDGRIEIGKGHYYVDGILCENDASLMHTLEDAASSTAKQCLVYLDVWERHVTATEDDDIREKALSGPDTSTRAQVVWRIRIEKDYLYKDPNAPEKQEWEPIPSAPDPTGTSWKSWVDTHWQDWAARWQPPHRGQLRAQAKESSDKAAEPCFASPEARYRGMENQLYRVEVHNSGAPGVATFKWSRDNGSVTFPVRQLDGKAVTLGHLGRDSATSLAVGDWVELVDDDTVPPAKSGSLARVQSVTPDDLKITVADWFPAPTAYSANAYAAKHVLLRRWDYRTDAPSTSTGGTKLSDGALLIEESSTAWITLERGVQVQFQPATTGEPAHSYRAGDYWLIPARIAIEDVEWPALENDPQTRLGLPPHGVLHHYAPLAVINVQGSTVKLLGDCRRLWSRLGD